MRRVVGKREIYLRVLDNFIAEKQKFVEEFVVLLQGEDMEATRQAIHSLKGVAATISADPLAELAKEIEQQVRERGEVDEAQIVRLSQHLQQVLDSIETLFRLAGYQANSVRNMAEKEPA